MSDTHHQYQLYVSGKAHVDTGYFPDATPGGADDPPTPVWAKGRKSIAEMMETNDDNGQCPLLEAIGAEGVLSVSPIAGQKGGGMDLDVRRAVGRCSLPLGVDPP